MTARADLYVIARLDIGDAAIDVYCCEVYFDHAVDGTLCGRTSASWSRTLQLGPDMSADLDGLDRAMAAARYFRTSSWRVRVTASGAVRYFADATAGLRSAVDGPVALARDYPA
ncbi:hypothetical protein ACWF9G_02785 [Nocardia sp. NPDC055029]